jgi:murein L,D-transpeptidase YafK
MQRLILAILVRCATAWCAGGLALVAASGTSQIVPTDPDSGARSLSAAQLPQAERVVVRKGERRMYLLNGSEVLRSYRVALGLMPAGTKERSGDYRTPEGSYRLTRRNTRSDFFLAIQVSYPNAADIQRARRNRWNPGGSIMVHGLPNSLRHAPDYYANQDWTDGCIALSNADMVEFWLLTHDNMPIDITP